MIPQEQIHGARILICEGSKVIDDDDDSEEVNTTYIFKKGCSLNLGPNNIKRYHCSEPMLLL
jgi:hypothetical protein